MASDMNVEKSDYGNRVSQMTLPMTIAGHRYYLNGMSLQELKGILVGYFGYSEAYFIDNELLCSRQGCINVIIDQYFMKPRMLGNDNVYHSINLQSFEALCNLIAIYFGETDDTFDKLGITNTNKCKEYLLCKLESGSILYDKNKPCNDIDDCNCIELTQCDTNQTLSASNADMHDNSSTNTSEFENSEKRQFNHCNNNEDNVEIIYDLNTKDSNNNNNNNNLTEKERIKFINFVNTFTLNELHNILKYRYRYSNALLLKLNTTELAAMEIIDCEKKQVSQKKDSKNKRNESSQSNNGQNNKNREKDDDCLLICCFSRGAAPNHENDSKADNNGDIVDSNGNDNDNDNDNVNINDCRCCCHCHCDRDCLKLLCNCFELIGKSDIIGTMADYGDILYGLLYGAIVGFVLAIAMVICAIFTLNWNLILYGIGEWITCIIAGGIIASKPCQNQVNEMKECLLQLNCDCDCNCNCCEDCSCDAGDSSGDCTIM